MPEKKKCPTCGRVFFQGMRIGDLVLLVEPKFCGYDGAELVGLPQEKKEAV